MLLFKQGERNNSVIYGDNRTTKACIPILDAGISLPQEELEILEAMAKRLSSTERR